MPEDTESNRWTNGYCGTFAAALHQRFGYPIHGIVERAVSDGDETIAHLFCIADGLMIDGDGIQPIPPAEMEATTYPGEKTEVVIRPYTLAELITAREAVEDVQDTKDAFDEIEAAIDRFIVPSQIPRPVTRPRRR